LRPALQDLMEAVRAAGGEPRLTGSGPTVYTLSDDPERAADVATRLAGAGIRATLTRTRAAAASIERINQEEEAG
jgi:4-diphosphocytidyl-2C-methyl-D-erythritol kinase